MITTKGERIKQNKEWDLLDLCLTSRQNCRSYCPKYGTPQCEHIHYQVYKVVSRDKAEAVVPTSYGGYECPNCKALFARRFSNFIDTNFCPNCGQRLSWEEKGVE